MLSDLEYAPIDTSVAIDEGWIPATQFQAPSDTKLVSNCHSFCLGCIGMIQWMLVLSQSSDPVIAGIFNVSTAETYLAVRYVPTTIGTLTTIWWRALTNTLSHITPFLSLAAQIKADGHRRPKVLRTLGNKYADNLFSCNPISVARSRHWLLFTFLLIHYVMELVIVPLKAALSSECDEI
jgi:hypothetical protein